MVIQARAEATRRRIIDAAVFLFTDLGYGDTGLADVMHRAEVSKGAFYYHFESKEALASAIIDEGVARLLETFRGVAESAAPALENTIRATFLLARMTQTDDLARIANQLRQALGQVSDTGAKTYLYSTAAFLEQVEKSFGEGDVRKDIAPEEVAETICVGVLGCHLLSDAIGDDPFARLARAWRVLLRSIVSEAALPYSHDFLARTAAQYTHSLESSPGRLTGARNTAPSIAF